jgi:hypothetical protein
VHGLESAFDPERVRWLDDDHIENEIRFGEPGSANESRIRVTGTNTVAHVTVAGRTSVGIFTLTGLRFRVGSLVAEDRSMLDFLKRVQRFPVASPASAFE